MTSKSISQRSNAIRRALDLVTEAMDLLDAHDGPADAAAHLGMGQQILRQAIMKPK